MTESTMQVLKRKKKDCRKKADKNLCRRVYGQRI